MTKYQNILKLDQKDQWENLSNIYDISIEYVKNNHSHRNVEHKIAAVYVVKSIYLQTLSFDTSHITEYIDKFFTYLDSEYSNYCSQFDVISDYFHLNLCFYKSFVENKLYEVDTNK